MRLKLFPKDDTNKVVIIKRNDVVTILSYENAMNILPKNTTST